MRYNNSCVCKKTSICPQCWIFIMLGVQVVGHAVIWSLAGRVAQCCGSYAQFFFLKNLSRLYNYLFALNEKNVSSFSSVISGCWYDWWSSYSMSLCPPPDIIVWPDRNNMLYLSTEITEKIQCLCISSTFSFSIWYNYLIRTMEEPLYTVCLLPVAWHSVGWAYKLLTSSGPSLVG